MESNLTEFYPIKLAEEAVTLFLQEGKVLSPPPLIPEAFQRQAGCFVTLKAQGVLRGCIGTIFPQSPTLSEEIIKSAISAATQDPRFPPLTAPELESLSFSVDVLEPPETIDSIQRLDPKLYGVIVRTQQKCGVLLPDLEGIDNTLLQVAIAKQKAGIDNNESFMLQRFKVTRYGKK